MAEPKARKQIESGLEGIVVARTSKSQVVGDEGRLVYQGYPIEELAGNASFEEVVWLLWYGHLPTAEQLDRFDLELRALRALPDEVHRLLADLPRSAVPMSVLRSAVSVMGCLDEDAEAEDHAAHVRVAKRLLARLPTVVAAFEHCRHGRPPVAPRDDLGHAANFLYMMGGEEPDEAAARAVDTYLVLLADHGFNASTFSSRVTAATMSDMYSAVTSAIGTLKGSLHGGANQRVMEMLESIGDPEAAGDWVMDAIARKQRIMGIGHRVYKTNDPRAAVLREMGDRLKEGESRRMFEVALVVADTAVEYFERFRPELGLYPNVDFYSAPVLYATGIPADQFTPLFAMSRIAGWSAHVLEQYADNRLIRPRAEYVGPQGRKWVPLAERKARGEPGDG